MKKILILAGFIGLMIALVGKFGGKKPMFRERTDAYGS